MGMLSSELRKNAEISQNGYGGTDLFTGGHDSVYTQIITNKECREHTDFDDASCYYDKIQMLFSLDLLETGTYQYLDDNCGTRRYEDNNDNFWWFDDDDYKNRLSVFEYLDEANKRNYPGNELMIKERIPTAYIDGVVLQDQQTADRLLDFLKTKGLVEKNENGIETILNKPVKEFLRVGTRISKELIK